MPSPGFVLLVLGLILFLGAALGFPLVDMLAPCGFLQAGCALSRVAIYWGILAMGAVAFVVGLLLLLFGPKTTAGYVQTAGSFGVRQTRRAGGFVVGKVRER